MSGCGWRLMYGVGWQWHAAQRGTNLPWRALLAKLIAYYTPYFGSSVGRDHARVAHSGASRRARGRSLRPLPRASY